MDFESGNIFVSEQDFVKEIGHWGLHAFKVDTCDDLNIFLSMSFDDFLSFAKEKARDVFYYCFDQPFLIFTYLQIFQST